MQEIDYNKPIQAVGGGATYILIPSRKQGTYTIIGYDWYNITEGHWNSTACWENPQRAVEAYSYYEISNLDTPSLKAEKPQEPEQPERLELEILRGFSRDVAGAPNGGIGVNKIKQAVSHMLGEYNLIGYKYAESKQISRVGPSAFWSRVFSDECFVEESQTKGGQRYPVFATHAVYQRSK